jgi:hypothetical protein
VSSAIATPTPTPASTPPNQSVQNANLQAQVTQLQLQLNQLQEQMKTKEEVKPTFYLGKLLSMPVKGPLMALQDSLQLKLLPVDTKNFYQLLYPHVQLLLVVN